MNTPKRIFVASVAVTAFVTAAILLSPSKSTSPPPSTTPTTLVPVGCQPSPANVIAHLLPGATWVGDGGCYNLTNATVKVAKPVVLNLNGSTFYDATAAKPIKPIIGCQNTTNFTVENGHLVGANVNGGYHAALVGGAGIDVKSCSNDTFDNVTTDDTFGDGLTLGQNPGKGLDANVSVNDYTVTNAGRQGFSPATVNGMVVNHLDIVSSADTAIDFESDVGAGLAGFLGIFNSTWNGSLYLQEGTLPGAYLEFDNDAGGQVHIEPHSGTPTIQWDGGSIHEQANTHGIVRSPFEVIGATVTLDQVAITRKPFKLQAVTQTPSYWLTNGAVLHLQDTAFPPPPGYVDATSSVVG